MAAVAAAAAPTLMQSLGPALIGAGGSLIGGMIGGKGDGDPNYYKLREAEMAGIYGQDGPFGRTYMDIDRGEKIKGEGHRKDDTYTLRTELSPEMEALKNALMGRVGAGRSTYTPAGMPNKLQSLYANSMMNYARPVEDRVSMVENIRRGRNIDAWKPQMPSYSRGDFGFGMGDGPVQVAPESEEIPQDAYEPGAMAALIQAMGGRNNA